MTATLPVREDVRPSFVPPQTTGSVRAPGLGIDLALAAVFGLALLLRDQASAGWLVGLYLLLVPGDHLRRAFGVRVATLGERMVLGCGASIAYLVLLTVVTEGLSLLVGVGRPFAEGPLLTAVLLTAPLLLLVAHRDGAAPAGPSVVTCSPLVLVLVPLGPLGVLLGAAALDNGAGPALSLVALGAAALLAVTCCFWRRDQAGANLALAAYGLALAVLWSFSARSNYLYGFDLHQEFAVLTRTLQAEVWRPEDGSAYNASLSLTSLPATLSVLTGIPGMALFKTVYPMVFAVFPAAVVVLVLRWTTPLVALSLTVLMAMNPLGFWQIAAIARQEVALVTFASLLVVLMVSGGTRRDRHALAFLLGTTCVLAHYSTSYVAVALLLAASVVGALLRRRNPGVGRGRTVHPALPISLLLVAVLWGSVLNQSTDNVSRTGGLVAAQPGLVSRDGLLQTWLGGGAGSEVSAQQLFEKSEASAAARPWLQTYSSDVQADFPAADAGGTVTSGVAAGSKGRVDLAYTLLRQLANLLVVVAVAVALGAGWRRRRAGGPGRAPGLVLVASLGAGALGLLGAVRVSQGLAAAYNSERLVVQLAPVTVIVCALVASRVVSRHRQLQLPLGLLAGGVLVLALLDATGVRGLVTEGNAGNLQTTGEFEQRYFVTDQDDAAGAWLADQWRPDNLVFADRYAALNLTQRPNMQSGVVDLLTPPMLDQRAYVYASTENVVAGRARGQVDGEQARYAFPTTFLDTYKTIVYSNGAARIYR